MQFSKKFIAIRMPIILIEDAYKLLGTNIDEKPKFIRCWFLRET